MNIFTKKLQDNIHIQQLNNGTQKMQEIAKKTINVLQYEKNKSDAQNRKMFSEKTKYANIPVKINEHTIYINTITVNSSMFPYILVYPKQ